MLPVPTSSVVNPSGFTVSVRPSLDTSNPPSTLAPSTNNAEKTGSPFFSKKSQKSLPKGSVNLRTSLVDKPAADISSKTSGFTTPEATPENSAWHSAASSVLPLSWTTLIV